MSTPTTDLDQFEHMLRERLHRLADHAPATVPAASDLRVAAPAPLGSRRRRTAGIGAAIALLAGGAGLTAIGLQGAAEPGGADTPEAAVEQFADALAGEDLLGMVDVTVPEEVTALRSALEDTTSEAKRLGLLDDAFALDGVAGVDVTVADLALATETLAPDLAAVTATSGSLAAAFDRTTFPLGRVLAGWDVSSVSTSRDLAAAPITLVTVRRGDRWFVSVGMSIAEALRRANGAEPPTELGILVEGSASPEAAAAAFYAHLADLDLRAASALLAPGEGDVFRRYGSLWFPPAERGVDDLRAQGLSITLRELAFVRVVDDDGRVTLDPETFVVEGTLPAGWAGSDAAGPTRVAEWPTIVSSSDGSGVWLLEPGVAVPATVDELPVEQIPEGSDAVQSLYETGELNMTWAEPDGTISPLFDPVPADAPPSPFRVERRDGCTTVTGLGYATAAVQPPALEQLPDGSVRTCDEQALVGVASALFLLAGGGSLVDLPELTLVEDDGEWFVSPIGTIAGQWLAQMRRLPDDVSVIDVPILSFLVGATTRSDLDGMLAVAGRAPAACTSIVEGGPDGAPVVIADPALGEVQACLAELWGSVEYSSSGVEVAVEPAPAPKPTTSEDAAEQGWTTVPTP